MIVQEMAKARRLENKKTGVKLPKLLGRGRQAGRTSLRHPNTRPRLTCSAARLARHVFYPCNASEARSPCSSKGEQGGTPAGTEDSENLGRSPASLHFPIFKAACESGACCETALACDRVSSMESQLIAAARLDRRCCSKARAGVLNPILGFHR